MLSAVLSVKGALAVGVAAAGVALAALELREMPGRAELPLLPPTPDDDTLRMLDALGYVDWSPAPAAELERRAVVRHEPDRSARGLNLYNSRPRSLAQLMDMQGNVVHAWESRPAIPGGWHHIEVGAEGELFAIVKNRALMKLDLDSRLVWRAPLSAHHDFAFDDDGRIYVLTQRPRRVELESGVTTIIDNGVAVLSEDGELRAEYSLWEILGPHVPRWLVRRLAAWQARHPDAEHPPERLMDIFHCNAIEILDRDVPGLGRRGDALISLWSFDAVFVVDLHAGTAGWRWGRGVLENPHHPTLLENGNLLIFDNGTRRKWSRVVEVDPVRREIVWQYRGTPPRSFYSNRRGAAQRLPNGNVLVTESDRGRVFEVTREGEIVWEFFNPDVRVADGTRAAIYRMQRVADGAVELEASVFSRLFDRVRSALPRAG